MSDEIICEVIGQTCRLESTVGYIIYSDDCVSESVISFF